MGEVGYSDSDNEVTNYTQIGRRVRFNQKFLNEVDSLESPRFGFTRGQSQDSFTTQCSTPRLNDKYAQLFNYNHQTYRSTGTPEHEQGDFIDPFDKIMSQTLLLEQLSNLPDVYISDKQQWDGFINTLPPSPITTPRSDEKPTEPIEQTNQLQGEINNFGPINPTDYPLLTSAIDRNWDNLLNFTQQGNNTKPTHNVRPNANNNETNTNENNKFKWWCDDQQSGLQTDGGTRLKRLDPQSGRNRPEAGVNTDLTSADMDIGGNRLKMLSKLNDQYQQRVQHIIAQNGDLNVDVNGVQGEGKEFIAATRDHLVKVHQQMEVLMMENLKLRTKIDKSVAMLGPLYDTITVLREETSALIMENTNLVRELKIARQDKAYAVEYCKSSNEALKQTNLEKDKILAEFNNIANSKVVLEREFKETINNMQNMKTKLVEWQAKVNGVTPVKKTVRFSEQSDLHYVSQSQPPATPPQFATPTICKSVQEQLQSYQMNCSNN